jgi:hypothetical protein
LAVRGTGYILGRRNTRRAFTTARTQPGGGNP